MYESKKIPWSAADNLRIWSFSAKTVFSWIFRASEWISLGATYMDFSPQKVHGFCNWSFAKKDTQVGTQKLPPKKTHRLQPKCLFELHHPGHHSTRTATLRHHQQCQGTLVCKGVNLERWIHLTSPWSNGCFKMDTKQNHWYSMMVWSKADLVVMIMMMIVIFAPKIKWGLEKKFRISLLGAWWLY